MRFGQGVKLVEYFTFYLEFNTTQSIGAVAAQLVAFVNAQLLFTRKRIGFRTPGSFFLGEQIQCGAIVLLLGHISESVAKRVCCKNVPACVRAHQAQACCNVPAPVGLCRRRIKLQAAQYSTAVDTRTVLTCC